MPGEFKFPCTANDQCDSDICLPTPDGKVCTKTCTSECPQGFRCVAHKIGSDITNICAPRFPHLCDPCSSNKDCNSYGDTDNVCVSFGPAGSFCGAACGPGKGLCPDGYTCQKQVDPESGKQFQQCVVNKGEECACSKLAIAEALSTQCITQNQYGKCEGKRECLGGGLTKCLANEPKVEDCNGLDDDCNGKTDDIGTESICKGKKNSFGQCLGIYKSCENGVPVCSAPDAQPETCNGKDDDCDGETDEGLCSDGNECTQDMCNSDGSCQHDPKGADGHKCDDGQQCTKTDKCMGGKCIGGNAKKCDDHNECTIDSCDDIKGCFYKKISGPCKDDGQLCTQDLCADGKCTHPATAEGGKCPDDGQACTQDICKGGTCIHPPLVETIVCKEDGNSCTADICQDGKCAHKPLDSSHECLDDGNPCTNDVCKAGTCQHTPVADGAGCADDGKVCTLDQCDKGKCAHKPALGKNCADDSDPCTADVCDENGKCAHKPASNKPCADDGQACTEDKCVNGKCKHIYNNAGCNDGDPCTLTDYCNLGTCKGQGLKKCDDGKKCTTDKCVKGKGCVYSNANLTCNDGNSCTDQDTCLGGKCVGKPKKNCDDGNPCTMDTCANNACQHIANQAPCKDDGNPCTSDVCANKVCTHPKVADGASCADDGNPCTDGKCNNGSCGQVDNGKVCDDGDKCTSNDKCLAGKCVGKKFKSCEDGNPCTKDYCDQNGVCQHDPLSGTACVAGSGECPLGQCAGGTCLSKADVTCQAKYKADLCSSVKVPGKCTAAGKCIVTSPPAGFSCPGCNGICLKCTIFGGISLKYCLELPKP